MLDEHLLDEEIFREIKRWYKGPVVSIKAARPGTVILDDALPILLRRFKTPTLVTINYADFWNKIPANRDYCVVCFKLSQQRALEVPEKLRALLSLPEWRTKRGRMGKVISVTDQRITFYSIA